MSEMTNRTSPPLNNTTDPVESAGQVQVRKKNPWWSYFLPYIPAIIKKQFHKFDQKVDGAASFFIKHAGKSRFMVAMSKKAQYLGIERLWYKGPKAFIYFFLFYLVRDTILYIIIPIFFAKMTS